MKITILKPSLGFTKIIILPLEAPVISGIFGILFPSSVVKQLQVTADYPRSKIEIGRFKVKLRIGSITGRFRSDKSKSILVKLKNFIGSFIPRPMVVIKMSDVILTAEKAYLAPDSPPEFAAGSEQFPSAIPPTDSDEWDPRWPVFDQEAMLEYFRNDEINDAEAVTFWIERWISHVVTKMKFAKSEKTRNKPTDDERTNSILSSISRVIFHSITIQLQNASVVLSGADAAFVKATREKYSPSQANLVLAKLPKAKRGLSIISADAIEIGFSSDKECNLFLCCAGVQVKVGNPCAAKSKKHMLAWHTIASRFDIVLELKGRCCYSFKCIHINSSQNSPLICFDTPVLQLKG